MLKPKSVKTFYSTNLLVAGSKLDDKIME